MATFAFACPSCGTRFVAEADVVQCASCRGTFSKSGGIWRFLPDSRAATFAEFLQNYQVVRKAEGWGAAAARYYQELPWVSPNDPLHDIWRTRSRSFQLLISQILRPLEATRSPPFKILDIGAGNCWLSYQLARRGHRIAAIDISTDDLDGLGTFVWYEPGTSKTGDNFDSRLDPRHRSAPSVDLRRRAQAGSGGTFIPIQAEFDHLPFAADQVDLVIFNAALHYSTDYHATLSEALRVLRADGHLIALDSPVYRNPASGDMMVRERAAAFQDTYGFSATASQTEGFLTYGRLGLLASTFDLQLRVADSVPGWRSTLRAVKTRLRGQRESAGFPILVMRRASALGRQVL